MSLPLTNVAPARTSVTRGAPLTARQRVCADSMSLNAIARPAAREPGPRVILVRCRTAAHVLSIGLVPGMKGGGWRLRSRIGWSGSRLAEEYGGTVRDRGSREQTQVGQAGD